MARVLAGFDGSPRGGFDMANYLGGQVIRMRGGRGMSYTEELLRKAELLFSQCRKRHIKVYTNSEEMAKKIRERNPSLVVEVLPLQELPKSLISIDEIYKKGRMITLPTDETDELGLWFDEAYKKVNE